MGGMVIGLLIQIMSMAKGRLAPIQKHRARTSRLCIGNGIKAQKIPTKTANETECRLRCSRFGSCGNDRSHRNEGRSSSPLTSGKKRRIVLRGIERSFLSFFKGLLCLQEAALTSLNAT